MFPHNFCRSKSEFTAIYFRWHVRIKNLVLFSAVETWLIKMPKMISSFDIPQYSNLYFFSSIYLVQFSLKISIQSFTWAGLVCKNHKISFFDIETQILIKGAKVFLVWTYLDNSNLLEKNSLAIFDKRRVDGAILFDHSWIKPFLIPFLRLEFW